MKKSLQIHFWGHVENTAGSVEKLVLTFARHQTRYTPSIACKSEHNGSGVIEGLAVHSFAESALKNRLLNKLLGLKVFTFDSLIPIIEEERPDVLHVHNRQELVDRLVARLTYRPAVVVHYHRNFAKPLVPQSADLLLAVSAATRQHVIEFSRTQKTFEVLHNPLSDAALSYKTIHNNNPVPVILYAGGGHEWKGLPDLLTALEKLHGNYLVKICGPALDGFHPPLDHIEVLGLIPHDQLMQQIQKADIVVMPSRKEAFGLIAMESLFLSKLLVASNVGGLSEFLNSECSILTQPGDPDDLAKGLQRALELAKNENERTTTLRKKARLVAEAYTPNAITERLENYYDQAVKIAAHS